MTDALTRSPASSDTALPGRRIAFPHIDGLDGLRGLAVIAVVLYHAGITWANGGFLGVEVFFVLSGFLITSLLIREWLTTGAIALRGFWARRARRLLPALFVLVIVIGVYYAHTGIVGSVPGLFGDGLAALFYYSNWHQIAVGSSYFVQSGPTSPFQHTWSLAIEEQFYVIWPLLVIGLAWMLTRARRGVRTADGPPSDAQAVRWLNALLGLALVMIAASAVDAALLFHGGKGLDRVYYGTDTRASGLLAGAALAILMARRRLAGPVGAAEGSRGEAGSSREAGSSAAAVRRSGPAGVALALISLVSAVALAGTLVLMARTNGNEDHWLYPWGFLLVDAISVGLITVILTTPRALASRVFAIGPLRWLGTISYGLYLWHFPLFLWIVRTPALHGAALFAVRIGAALAVSVASYYLVEQPIRRRRWPVWMVRGMAPITAGAGVVSLALAASAAAIPSPASAPAPPAPTKLAGNQGPCGVQLANTEYTGEVAPPKSQESTFQTYSLARGTVTWPAAQTTKTFTTCPPERAMVVGDSIAFTIGVPFLYNEQEYGLATSDAATLGCAFGVRGEVDVNGKWEDPPKGCRDEIASLAAEATAFGANEIIFELGYRDEFNWKVDGKVVHLCERAYDDYVEARMRRFIKVLGEDGKRKLLFLSVPYVKPPAQADGSPAPQASTKRHSEINALLSEAAKSDPGNATVLDIDKVISPDNQYTTDLNGQLCRFDGIHVTVYCAEVLEPHILEAARDLLGMKAG
jgi:peptidoglycan/LPS O-acetylase OafA/YrhL